MNEGLMLERVLVILREKIAEGGEIFLDMALSIVILLLAVEIIRSAVDLVSGRGFTIGARFFTCLVILIFLGSFREVYDGFNQGIMEDSGLVKHFSVLSNYVKTRHDSNLIHPNPKGFAFYVKMASGIDVSKFDMSYVLRVIFTSVSLFVCLILLVIIVYRICREYAVFLILLSLGPVPVSLMMSEETRPVGLGWMNLVISKLLTLFMYSAVLKLSHAWIVKNQYKIFMNSGGTDGLYSNFIPAILLIFLVLFLIGLVSDLVSGLAG